MLRKISFLTLVFTLYTSFAYAIELKYRNLDDETSLGTFVSISNMFIPLKSFDITNLKAPFVAVKKPTGFDLNFGISTDIIAIEANYTTIFTKDEKDNNIELSYARLGCSLMPKIPLLYTYIFPYVGVFAGAGGMTYIKYYFPQKTDTFIYGAKTGVRLPLYRPSGFLTFLISSVYIDANAAYTIHSYKDNLENKFRLHNINYQLGLGVSF